MDNTTPENYEYFTDEDAKELGITDPEEIQGIRDMLYQLEHETSTRWDYYYDVHLKKKNEEE